MFIPIPTQQLDQDRGFSWNDEAYGLPPQPPGPFRAPNVPEITPQLEIAIDFLIAMATHSENTPLEASRALLDGPIRNLIQQIQNPPHRLGVATCPLLRNYDPNMVEWRHGTWQPRPTQAELENYNSTSTAIARHCQQRLNEATAGLDEQELQPRTPPRGTDPRGTDPWDHKPSYVV